MKFLYVRVAEYGPDITDGGSIFDRRVLEALARLGADVQVEEVHRKRLKSVPTWLSQVPQSTMDKVHAAKRDGRAVLISHEALFHIAFTTQVDCVLVHNYFAEFTFRDKPLLEQYYRAGSYRYYRKCFAATKSTFFISHREHRLALRHFPDLAGRTDICVPPPLRLPLEGRSNSVLHMSGSENWRPKRLSMLKAEDKEKIKQAGFVVKDFIAPVAPSAALINDRFEVGFKLKLAQMLYCRDVIASFCDLSEEIENLCPGNPFYLQVTSVDEALSFFNHVFANNADDEISAYYASLEEKNFLPTWDSLATKIAMLVNRTNIQTIVGA